MHEITNKIDIEALRVFCAAVRLGNLSDAADRLGVSQSTASRRVAMLEDALGTKLLQRNRDGVVPTEVGRKVAEAAEPIEQLIARVGTIGEGLRRNSTVLVSASDGLGGYWLPICMARFAEDHPEVCIQVACNVVTHVGNVGRAESDIDVVYYPPTDPDAVILGKGTLPMRMFASDGYIAAHGSPSTLEEVSGHRVCALEAYFEEGLGDGDWNRHAQILRSHERVAYRVNSSLALGFAIRSGWGIGIQPSLVELTERGMVMLPPEVYQSESRFWLVAHKDLKDNPAPRLVSDWIKSNIIGSLKGRATFEAVG
jgi:DNA-binding transcriptional LysR family regulator